MRNLIAAAFAALLAVPAFAQVIQVDARNSAKFVKPGKVRIASFPQNCGLRDEVVALLEGKYGEEVMWEAASSRGHASQMWQGDKSWSWTFTLPSGVMCVSDAGLIQPRMSS